MKFVALVSGGKDSCFAAWKAINAGHELIALANLHPSQESQKDELDSFMFQTVGHQVLERYGECFGVPMIRRPILGKSKTTTMDYHVTNEDEVEDLYLLLQDVKTRFPDVQAVSSGALFSDYQRIRVENVCSRLGLVSLAYLWRIDQKQLLQEMVNNDMHAILIKVAAIGLQPEKHVGKSIQQLYSHLLALEKKYGINVCGEGGEYESLVLDCPLFKKKIVIDDARLVIHSEDAFASVGYLTVNSFHLEDKVSFDPKPTLKISAFLGDEHEKRLSASLDDDYGDYDNENEEMDKVHSNASVSNLLFLQPLIDNIRYESMQKENYASSMQGTLQIVANYGSISCSRIHPQHQDVGQENDVCMETLQLLDSLKVKLETAGATMEDVFYVNLYLADMQDFVKVNSVYCTFFQNNPPSRTCIQSILPGHARVQMDLQFCTHHQRNVLHVQSISGWANACIGPYSQANCIDETLYLAGMIGLIPETMQLADFAEADTETPLEIQHMLRNTENVLGAIKSSLQLIRSATLFVSSASAWKTVSRCCLEKSPHLKHICGIVVPALPRGATAEIQVLATTSNTQDSSGYEPSNDDDDDYPVSGSDSARIKSPHFMDYTRVHRSSAGLILEACLSLGVKTNVVEYVFVCRRTLSLKEACQQMGCRLAELVSNHEIKSYYSAVAINGSVVQPSEFAYIEDALRTAWHSSTPSVLIAQDLLLTLCSSFADGLEFEPDSFVLMSVRLCCVRQ